MIPAPVFAAGWKTSVVRAFNFQHGRVSGGDDIERRLTRFGLYVVDLGYGTVGQSLDMRNGQRQLLEFHPLYRIPLNDIPRHELTANG
jgi:hypothetical protein